jgi:hypothetical protein
MGKQALAAVAWKLVSVDVARGARGNHTLTADTGCDRGRRAAQDAAGATIQGIGLQVEAIVDDAVAVVVDAVA